MGSLRCPQDGTRDWPSCMVTPPPPDHPGSVLWAPRGDCHVSASLCSGALDGALVPLLTQTPNYFLQKALAPCSDPLPITPQALNKHLQVQSGMSTLLCMCSLGFQTHRPLFNQHCKISGLQITLTWPVSQPLSEVTLKRMIFREGGLILELSKTLRNSH